MPNRVVRFKRAHLTLIQLTILIGLSTGATSCGSPMAGTAESPTITPTSAPTVTPPPSATATEPPYFQEFPQVLVPLPEGRVAFTADSSDMFVINTDGELTQLTFDQLAVIDWQPEWSPDGHWLAFDSFDGRNFARLRILDPSHPDATPLNVEVEAEWPTWSPDGGELIYFGPEGLMRMKVDGTGQTLIAGYDTLIYDLAGTPTIISPDWSPDGEQLAFALGFGSGCEQAIGLLNLNTLGFQQIMYHATSPAWSPDGRRIALEMCDPNDFSNLDIWVMDANGANLTRLTNHPDRDFGPVWSPSGQYLMFGSWRDGDSELYVMNADGTNEVRLTQGGALGADWGP